MNDANDEAGLDEIERLAFTYFVHEVNEQTGLVRDTTRAESPATIAGSGFALACYAVGAERKYITREHAARLAHTMLRFLWDAPQSAARDVTGWHGFFYHFLDLETGRRVWHSEISTIDTAIAMAGILVAGTYFDADLPAEQAIRKLADDLYRRVDWPWAVERSGLVSMGWRPKSGFIPCGWQGYTEALLLYILGLGSPTHSLAPESYDAWTRTYTWRRLYGAEQLYAGPLFIHQLSHAWIDFRGIQDAFMRAHGIDYFENSRRATYAQREYARRNPRQWVGYSATSWGITASDGPGPAIGGFRGRTRRFYGYHARGIPRLFDDGTLSPWAMVASLPFAPEIVLPSMRAVDAIHPETKQGYGYTGSFNPSFPNGGWVSEAHYAINQGPVVLMIENHRSGLLWQLMRRCPYIATGLRRAGFTGGWLA